MFYIILWLTLIGNIVMNTYFAEQSRKKWIWWVAIYKSIFMAILLLPILYFGDINNVTLEFVIASLVIWVIWAWWFLLHLKTYEYLPIGVVWALINLYNIWILILAYFVFWESLSPIWYVWAGILLLSLWYLWMIHWESSDSKKYNYPKWLLYVFLRIITLIIWIFGFIYFSREVDPYYAIYLSEFTVLLWFIPFVLYHISTTKEDIVHIFKWSEIYKFFLMCIFPALFSFGLFYSSTIGNPSVATLTLSTSSIFIALVSWLFYKEKLNTLQWSMIVLSVVWLVMINI